MSDDTQTNPGAGGDVIATDEVTTLNGAGSAGIKVQRFKVCFGDDGDSRDASTAFPLPAKLGAGDSAGALVVGTVLQAPLTKGTQGANGVSTQDLKDAGRAIVNAATAIAGVVCVNAEAMVSLNVSRNAAGPAAVTSIAVTANKRYRITGITVGDIVTAAAVMSGRISLRLNATGAVTVTDPIVKTIPLSSPPATAQMGNELHVPMDLEISGTQQVGLSQVFSVAGGTMWASIDGYEY